MPPGIGTAIEKKGEKMIFLNDAREAGLQPTLVLRDAVSTYITT
jgi:hypothetical protein